MENLLLYSSKPSLGVYQLAGHFTSSTWAHQVFWHHHHRAINDIRRKGIHCVSERSRQLTHKEVQQIYPTIFLSLYLKISAIASGATPLGAHPMIFS
jgi:hypothetical protein